MCAQKKTRRRISADEPAKPAGRELRRKVYKTGNGLLNFSMHAFDQSDASTLAQLTQERAEFSAFSLVGSANVAELDPETVAKRYLAQALQSSTVPTFTAPKLGGLTSEFKSLGTVTVPVTGTTTVKFRQTLGSIPVYGSLITVELNKAHNLVSLTSSIGEPKGVSPVARLAPAAAVKAVERCPGFKKQLANIVPQLMFYFDKGASKWRLVFFATCAGEPKARRPNEACTTMHGLCCGRTHGKAGRRTAVDARHGRNSRAGNRRTKKIASDQNRENRGNHHSQRHLSERANI